jgi:dCTP diphosphatase
MLDSTLGELTRMALKFRDEREWKQFHNPKDVAVSLLLEASELLEIVQWRNGEQLQVHLTDRKEHVGQELSDVLYWVLLLAHDQNIDLPAAFRAKLKENAKKYPIAKAKGFALKYTEFKVSDGSSRRSIKRRRK